MEPKPAHLAPQYGEQFEDGGVAEAYRSRPPYPPELFEVLERLLPGDGRTALELGCGTGDLSFGLAPRVDRLDAVEPSAEMLKRAQLRAGPEHGHIRWVASRAEVFSYAGPYALAVAAESLHWMDWGVVLPAIRAALLPGASLAIVSARAFGPHAWQGALLELIARYSTNREFVSYDIVDELTRRGMFRQTGRHQTAPIVFEQTIAEYVESFHSRNGFSRERMGLAEARAFDAALEALVTPYCPDGCVRAPLSATVSWGQPSGE